MKDKSFKNISVPISYLTNLDSPNRRQESLTELLEQLKISIETTYTKNIKMEKYYVLKKKIDGTLLSYDYHGALAKVPAVYLGKPNKKAILFDAEMIEVQPRYAIVDEMEKPYIYILTENDLLTHLPKLTIAPNHKVIIINHGD